MSQGKSGSISKEEYLQARSRTILGLIVMLVVSGLFWSGLTERVVVFWIAIANVFTIAWLMLLRHYPGDFRWRRSLISVFDISVISYTLYLMGEQGALFYFVYLWVIVGNGMRFGLRSLLEIMVMGVTGFGIVLSLTGYWRENIYIGLSLLAGMIVLPMFYISLIKRLHSLTDQLDLQLNQAVHAASHDDLTGLLNRNSFFTRVQQMIEHCQSNSKQFALVYIDLDGFKAINDTFGHHHGDKLLVNTANQLKTLVRKQDAAARLGGDEFAVLFYDVSFQEVQILLQRLTHNMVQQLELNQQTRVVTASVGASLYPQHGLQSDRLVKAADMAMYESKRMGKNGYTIAAAAA